jgi:hypothetical protein
MKMKMKKKGGKNEMKKKRRREWRSRFSKESDSAIPKINRTSNAATSSSHQYHATSAKLGIMLIHIMLIRIMLIHY